ncbi:MAG: MarR family transcriptional regulator [Chloroflexales bacterium]|nr:MarR family transcriptional regulator [Chloroflexales bacterium]
MISLAQQQYRMIHDIYILLDDGDRRILRSFMLNPSQYTLLTLLDNTQGQRLTDLSEQLFLNKSTITRLVDQLEQVNLVQRVADPDDRRVQRVVLTTNGAQLRTQAKATHDHSIQQRLNVLSEQEQHQLGALLSKLRESLREDLHCFQAPNDSL